MLENCFDIQYGSHEKAFDLYFGNISDVTDHVIISSEYGGYCIHRTFPKAGLFLYPSQGERHVLARN